VRREGRSERLEMVVTELCGFGEHSSVQHGCVGQEVFFVGGRHEGARQHAPCLFHSLSITLILLGGFRYTYEFGLVNHWCEDKLRAPNAFVECATMQLRSGMSGRSTAITII